VIAADGFVVSRQLAAVSNEGRAYVCGPLPGVLYRHESRSLVARGRSAIWQLLKATRGPRGHVETGGLRLHAARGDLELYC
jgi:stage V sporulation protein SpoVS